MASVAKNADTTIEEAIFAGIDDNKRNEECDNTNTKHAQSDLEESDMELDREDCDGGEEIAEGDTRNRARKKPARKKKRKKKRKNSRSDSISEVPSEDGRQQASDVPPPPEPDAIFQTVRRSSTVYTGYTLHSLRHGHGIYIDSAQNRYEGQWRNDRANGHGVKEFAGGGRHEGMYKDDKRHGFGKYIWGNGDRYVGEWREGRMDGRGTFVWGSGDLYEGEWRMGRMHGRGTKRLANGDVYEGEWRNGMAQGWGKKQFSCGDVHEGYYVEDKRRGFGLYVWVNGDRYVGEWQDGRMHGRGVKIMANGDVYNGQFLADRAQGFGVKIFSCGDKHEGYYYEDKRHQFGSYAWRSGDRYEGHWSNGRMCGLGVKHMANGDMYDGEWYDDQAHGYGIKTFANGDVHEGEYRHDVRELHGVYHWVNGDTYDGEWKNGEQSGIGMYKYANGDSFEGRWEAGRKNGPGYFKTSLAPPNPNDGAGNLDVPPNGGNLGLAESPVERIFFEVWSSGSRMHREEMTRLKRENLPTVRDMCRPRTPLEIIRVRGRALACETSTGGGVGVTRRRPLAVLDEGTTNADLEEGNSNPDNDANFADRWRWVWEPAANSGVSGFWGRRVRQADILNAENIVGADFGRTGAHFGVENSLTSQRDLRQSGLADSNPAGHALSSSSTALDGDTYGNNGAAHRGENSSSDRSPFPNVLAPYLLGQEHGFAGQCDADSVSVASVGSAGLEFSNSPSNVEESKLAACSSVSSTTNGEVNGAAASKVQGEAEDGSVDNLKSDKTNDAGSGDGEHQDGATRADDYMKQKAGSFSASVSSSSLARRRLSDSGIRLSKRRLRGRGGNRSYSQVKRARTAGDPSATLQPCDEDGEVRDEGFDEDSCSSSSELRKMPSFEDPHKSDGKGAGEVTEAPQNEHAKSPSPKHSGGDASGYGRLANH